MQEYGATGRTTPEHLLGLLNSKTSSALQCVWLAVSSAV